MNASERKKAVGEVTRTLSSTSSEELERAIELCQDGRVLSAVIGKADLSGGCAIKPKWRIKRTLWPLAHRRLGALLAAHWSSPALEPVRARVCALVPLALWDGLPEGALEGQAHTARLGGAGVPLRLARVPAAAGTIGCRESDIRKRQCLVPEPPRREVVVSRDLYVGATLVTASQWSAVMDDTFPSGELAVVCRHAGAAHFCNELSALEGLDAAYEIDGHRVTFLGLDRPGYRLLTSAEWEMACRAGTTTATYGGSLASDMRRDRALEGIAWHGGQYGDHEVGSLLPNAHGLYDMLGLSWERCWDRHSETHHDVVLDPVGDLTELDDPERDSRVIRGGSVGAVSDCRAGVIRSDHYTDQVAFRVCRNASPQRAELVANAPTNSSAVSVRPVWENVALEFLDAEPRALARDSDRTHVALAGGVGPRHHRLLVLSADLKTEMHEWKTPYLVSTVAAHEGLVFFALGPGQVMVAKDAGARAPVTLRTLMNPGFAFNGGEMLIYTSHQGFFVDGQPRDGVQTVCYDGAIDDWHIYGGYRDGRVRAYPRTGKRPKLLKQGNRVSADRGKVYISGPKNETITILDGRTLAQIGTLTHARSTAAPRVLVAADWIISHSRQSVCVHVDGEVVFRWDCPEGSEVNDVVRYQQNLHVAVGDILGNGGRILELPVPLPTASTVAPSERPQHTPAVSDRELESALSAEVVQEQRVLAEVSRRFGTPTIAESVQRWIMAPTMPAGRLRLSCFRDNPTSVTIEQIGGHALGTFPAAMLGSDGAGVELWVLLDSGAVISLHHDATLFEVAAGIGAYSREGFVQQLVERGSRFDLSQLLEWHRRAPGLGPEELLTLTAQILKRSPEDLASALEADVAFEFVFALTRDVLEDAARRAAWCAGAALDG